MSQYFLAQNHEKTGPFTLEQLREMWQAGAVYPQTLYWENGMADWQPLSHLDSSLLHFGPTTSPAFPVTPVTSSTEPSADGLPAGNLPAPPPAFSEPGSPHSLIAPTALPPTTVPPGALDPARAEMPPSAYLSLIFAVAGLFCCVFGHGIGILPGLALLVGAVVCGHTARAAIAASGNRLPGLGVAIAGMSVGYGCLGMVTLVFVLGILLVVVFLAMALFTMVIGSSHH